MDFQMLQEVLTFHHWFILILLGILSLLYVYLTWNFGYWERQKVKVDKPWPVFGTVKNPFVTPLDEQDIIQYKKYGRVYGVYEGREPVLIIADPELIKLVLVKDFHVFRNRMFFPTAKRDRVMNKSLALLKGDEWKNIRNISIAWFTTGKLKQMSELINNSAENIINYLETFAEKKETIDFSNVAISYAMDAIATCGFGIKLSSLNEPDSEFVKYARLTLKGVPKLAFISMLFPPLVEVFPSFMSREAVNYFIKLLEKVISTREKQNVQRKDILQILINATQKNPNENKAMDYEYVIPQAVIFFIAGFDTVSNTICFIFYCLIMYPDIQEKMIKELDEVLKRHDNVINYDSIGEMQYMDMIISETLRMHPPISRIQRMCEVDGYKLNGITLKKGMTVGIPIYCLHQDEEFYPNAKTFDPERFSPKNRSKINPYTYLPFGYGSRNCIGMRLALLILKFILTHIFRNFRANKCAETKVPFERNTDSFIVAMKSLKLTLERRKVLY